MVGVARIEIRRRIADMEIGLEFLDMKKIVIATALEMFSWIFDLQDQCFGINY